MTQPRLPLATDLCICEHTHGQHLLCLPQGEPCTASGCPCDDFQLRRGPRAPSLGERIRAAVDAYRNPQLDRSDQR